MLLGGLWHGASWNFVIWGGYHGALLSLERILGIRERQRWSIFDPLRVALTFALASISWIFFRAATLHDSVYILRRLCSGAHGHILWLHWQLWFVLAALVLAVLEESYGWFERLPEAPAWVYASAIAVCLFCLEADRLQRPRGAVCVLSVLSYSHPPNRCCVTRVRHGCGNSAAGFVSGHRLEPCRNISVAKGFSPLRLS